MKPNIFTHNGPIGQKRTLQQLLVKEQRYVAVLRYT